MLRSIVFTSMLLVFGEAHAQNRLTPWFEMAGCWQSESQETNTAGEVFRQIGRKIISFEGDDLHISETFRVTEATGLYAPLLDGGLRRYTETWSFDAESNLIVFTVDNGSPRRSALSPDGHSYYRTSIFHHPRRQMTLTHENRGRIVDANTIETSGELRDIFGDYRETYRTVWRRLNAVDGACLFTE